jgi:hypothetical protein
VKIAQGNTGVIVGAVRRDWWLAEPRGRAWTVPQSGDLDESRRAWLVRAAVSKTRRPRWVELPEDLFGVVAGRLPAQEDRDPEAPLFSGVTADRLRMAIGRACRDAGVSHFSPHALRHRRISLLHVQGVSWAQIGERVGQRNLAVTANTYTHILVDGREVDRGAPARACPRRAPPVHTPEGGSRPLAGAFWPSIALAGESPSCCRCRAGAPKSLS